MTPPLKFLVIDDHEDNGALLMRSLGAQFPKAVIKHCVQSCQALEAIATEQMDAVVLHRTAEQDAVTFIRTLRVLDSQTVIIVVSGIDRSEPALAAGASAFVNYDKWSSVGTVVADALKI